MVKRWHVNLRDPSRYNYITGSGHIVVLARDGSRIVKDISWQGVPTRADERVFEPEGIAFAPDGGFWGASRSRVIRFSKDFRYVSQFGTDG